MHRLQAVFSKGFLQVVTQIFLPLLAKILLGENYRIPKCVEAVTVHLCDPRAIQ